MPVRAPARTGNRIRRIVFTRAPDKLFKNRDLAVTTDFRDVFGEIRARHCNVPMADMPKPSPLYAVDSRRFRNVCTA